MPSYPGHDTSYLTDIIAECMVLFTPSWNGSHNPNAYTTREIAEKSVEFSTEACVKSFEQTLEQKKEEPGVKSKKEEGIEL